MKRHLARGKPSPLAVYLGCVITAGILVIGHSASVIGEVGNQSGWIALAALAIVAASFALKLPGVPIYISISDTFFITSALLYGAAPATLTIALDSLIISLRRRNSLRQLLFNSTSSAIALWCGIRTYFLLSPPVSPSGVAADSTIIVPLASLATVYFLLNTGLTAIAVALSKDVPAFQLWRRHFATISLNYFAAGSAAFFLLVVVRHLGIGAIAAVIPLVLVCHLAFSAWLGRVEDAERHLARVNQLYMSTVSALSAAIEAKDGVTSDHIQRVQAYATGLARELRVTDSGTIQAIEAAALLHDTGKLAIPEHILNKPGRLTPSEFETMKSHVSIGADILSAVEFPYPVVPIVRAHHENWDGTGYPNGLRGEEIPIGARILSVVDCFDALSSDRPYRPAMSEAAALDVLLRRRGTMYDPVVVDTFVRVYKDLRVPEPKPQLQAVTRHIRSAAKQSAEDPQIATPMPRSANNVSDELLGFVSLSRVASGSPTARDVAALAANQLRQLAPDATFVLFALDDTKMSLASQHITGRATGRVPPLTIRMGECISGWAAAHGRSISDSDAALDLGPGFSDVLRFAVAVPLMLDGEVIGVLTAYGLEPFGHELALTLEMIAPHLATALRSAVTEPAHVSAGVPASGRARQGLSLVARSG